jgi:putative transferase (TIGR04331 family)
MNKHVLITSSVKTHKKNYKYFNYGCLNLNNNNREKDVILNHPWDKHKNYQKDSSKINKTYLQLLKQLSYILNKHHKIKKNTRYWKIIIGPWLHCFINAYYEKNLLCKIIFNYKKKLIIPVVDLKFEKHIPENFFTFFAGHIYSSNWNDYLFSYIVSKKKLQKNLILRKKKQDNKKTYKKYNTFNFSNFLRKFFVNLIKILFYFRIKKQPLIFFNTYLSFKDKIFLIYKNLSLPFNINDQKNPIKPDKDLRKKLSEDIDKNNINNDLLKLSLLNIPIDYLENFSFIGQTVFKSLVNMSPKAILTSNGLYSSSFQARYIAECTAEGAKLIIAQHGGRYENIKNFFHIDYEIDISDYFLSWGMKNNMSKIKNIGMIKPFKKSIKTNVKKDKILFLMFAKGRFTRTVDSEINVKKLHYYYKNICPNFYSILNDNLKKNLIYRSSLNNYWSEKELLTKKCNHSKIDFERHKSDLFEAAKKSKVVVCSYLSTTFMELMAANTPVILFTPFSLKSYNNETIASFNLLEKNKIYFNSYDKAAKFINKNWMNIDDWWNTNNVQKSRKAFLNKFCKINKNLRYDIQKIILK